MTRFALDARGLAPDEAMALLAGTDLSALQVPWPSDGPWRDRATRVGIQVALLDLEVQSLMRAADPVANLSEYIHDAIELGCRKVAVRAPWTGGDVPAERGSALDRWCRVLRDAARPAEDAGVTICVGMGGAAGARDSCGIANCAELAEVLGRINRGNVLVDLDAGVLLRSGEDPAKAVARFAGRIGHARLGRRGEAPNSVLIGFLQALNTFGYGDVVVIDTYDAGVDRQRDRAAAVRTFLDEVGGDAGRDDDRLRRIRTAMGVEGLDLLVCVSTENLLAVTGYWPMNGTCVAIVPLDGEPQLLVPAGEETWAARCGWSNLRVYQAGRVGDPPFDESIHRLLLDRVGAMSRHPRTVGVEGPFRSLVPPHMAHEASGRHEQVRAVVSAIMGDEALRAVDGMLTRVKAIKTERELRAIRRVSTIADVGLETFRRGLADGVRDVDLATDVERAIERFGVGFESVTRARAYAYVMSGPQTSQCHLDYEFSSPRAMAPGDIVLMELAVVADGYWNDLSRVYTLGAPNEVQARLFEVAEGAFEAARHAAIPGATGADVDSAAREVIAEAGLAEAYPHQTGHGVGMAFHEPFPLLRPRSTDVLKPGMVIAIEPGVYVPGVGGVRNEDDCLVAALDGARSLQTTPHNAEASRLEGTR